MANLSVNNSKLKNRVQEHPTYTFYKKYFWKQIAADHATSGRILRTIYCQFGNWCVEKGFRFGDDDFTKLFWFKQIVPYLCYEDPCVKVLNGHTYGVCSVIKLNETTIVSGSGDNTLRIWDLANNTSQMLTGHEHWVLSVVKLNDTTIVSVNHPTPSIPIAVQSAGIILLHRSASCNVLTPYSSNYFFQPSLQPEY